MSLLKASSNRLLRLDGIRAVAIIAVIVSHHAMFESYGWAGVDLFFILSGFLITTILRRTRTDDLYWKPFYIKRAFRILPPMFLLMIVTAVTTRGWTIRGFLFYVFFLGNLVDLTRYSIYLLGVLWSLAVEEHFYFVWPIAARFLDRTKLLLLAVIVVIAEPVVRYLATFHTHHYFSIYELTPYRLDGLAAGAILSLLLESKGNVQRLRTFTPGIALVSLASLVFLPIRFTNFIREANTPIFNALGYTLVVVFCFAVVGSILVYEDSVVAKVLAWRPLVFVGEISYGMYLYHRLVMATVLRLSHVSLQTAQPHDLRPLIVIDLPLTIAIAYLSFRFVEKPLIGAGRQIVERQVARAYARH